MCTKLISGACVVVVLGMVAAPAALGDITIKATQSCRTDIGSAGTNKHDSSKLSVRSDSSSCKSWIKFDISGLDVASLEAATLTVALHDPKAGDRNFNVSCVNDDCRDNIDWDERSLTWNNAPGNNTADFGGLDAGRTTLLGTVNFTDGVSGDAFTIDVLDALLADTDGIVQFVLHNSNGLLNFATHDHSQEAWRPFIVVTEAPKGRSRRPSPVDGAQDVCLMPVLSWGPGTSADGSIPMHMVFFSEDFNDVNDGIGGVMLDACDYPAPGSPLDFSTTYYWRVDEIDAPPSSAVYRGSVWSFTTEPRAYLIEDVQATASSSSSATTGPANLVDASGLTLDADGQWVHDTDDEAMWQSASSGLPATVVFEFDRPYKLYEMKIWNHNTTNEGLFGLGAKEVTIEVADSNEGPWTPLAEVTLSQAPGQADTPATDTIPMMGAMAGSVRLTIRSSHGGLATAALAEVQFFHIPVTARELKPADGATLTSANVTLAWRSGREAVQHEVYLATEANRALVEGSDPAALLATIAAQGSYGSYNAPGLNLSQTYVWKVTEVNTVAIPSSHDTAILSFTTPDYEVVDDMESYKNVEFKEIWATWLDGTEFGTKDPTNGSVVGANPTAGDYGTAPGQNGGQSLPIWFANTAAAPKSEAIRTSAFGDWTRSGIKSLRLWFYGDAGNSGNGRLYVKINNSAPIYSGGAATDLTQASWQPFNIDLSTVGVTLNNVTKLAVGVEGIGATGVIRIDDIRLYGPAADIPLE